MRKIKTLFPILLYSLGHAAVISLGAVCFLNVAAIVLTPFGLEFFGDLGTLDHFG